MIRRPPRSTLDRSSAASDVYKRQGKKSDIVMMKCTQGQKKFVEKNNLPKEIKVRLVTVSYTHLRAHETVLDLVCRLLLEKKKNKIYYDQSNKHSTQYNYEITTIQYTLTTKHKKKNYAK